MSPQQINVARLVEVGKPLEVGTADKPVPARDDVLVKVDSCGLVPNSANIVRGAMEGRFPLPPLPAIFGLDAAGTVEAVGERVFNVKVGDRVYVNPHLTCGTCAHCRAGGQEQLLCPDFALRAYFAGSDAGTRHFDHYPYGALSQYLLSPANKVAVLADSISLEEAARFGYIGTSYGALKKAALGPGKTLLINGVTGTLGVAAVALALGMGATKILGIGRNPDRLEQARKLAPAGSSRVETRSSEDEGDLGEWVKSHTDGLGVDIVYDCLGVGGDAETSATLLRTALKPGGRIILAAGGAEGEIGQSYAEFQMRSTPILGSTWITDGDLDEMIALIGTGVVDLSFLEHKAFPLDKKTSSSKSKWH
ncbi:hypothetical protein Rhopal_007326-T1 [Rhodotorula paludigena]|uniref:Enoyl reductase (ER) domain-containing protein n=1 Tax=Rhodotorula paludigena TaxID=86838 RepID=A0AAV5GZ05_9BASI|nr:hypothetical protein Rhopal_007326-T1 [Rhodotorula paludigena]